MSQLTIRDLGKDLDFQEIWDLQEALVQQRREGKINDTVLLLEHAPVFTIGRTRDRSSLNKVAQLAHPTIEINRGGQGTFHGPGQLVGYVILDLNKRKKDLHAHLRNLEESIIIALEKFGIVATRQEGLTGVWVGSRKIASLGVGVRSWVTLHGFALNVEDISLPAFDSITPCGITGVTMTTAEREAGRPLSVNEMKKAMTEALEQVFGA